MNSFRLLFQKTAVKESAGPKKFHFVSVLLAPESTDSSCPISSSLLVHHNLLTAKAADFGLVFFHKPYAVNNSGVVFVKKVGK